MTGNWKDDPDIKAAIARAAEMDAALRAGALVAEAEMTAAGLRPVTVVHGPMESDDDVELICGVLPRLAEEAGHSPGRRGGSDYMTYFFDGPEAGQAAVRFIAAVSGIAPRWWRVTATATPVY